MPNTPNQDERMYDENQELDSILANSGQRRDPGFVDQFMRDLAAQYRPGGSTSPSLADPSQVQARREMEQLKQGADMGQALTAVFLKRKQDKEKERNRFVFF